MYSLYIYIRYFQTLCNTNILHFLQFSIQHKLFENNNPFGGHQPLRHPPAHIILVFIPVIHPTPLWCSVIFASKWHGNLTQLYSIVWEGEWLSAQVWSDLVTLIKHIGCEMQPPDLHPQSMRGRNPHLQ